MVKVNPDILRWARETAGLSIEEASRKLSITDAKGLLATERLAALESGNVIPTRPMLVKMAKQYHRPLLVFYMSNPPPKGNRGQDFRTLTQEYSQEVDGLVDALLRGVQARQNLVRQALEDEEEAYTLPFVGSMKISNGILELVESVTKTLEFDYVEFQRKPYPEDAFAYARACAERIGLFVLLLGDLGSYHTDIGIEAFRGFAIADDVAPFIVINDLDSKSAWSFTLMHEIAHVWLGQTGISNLYSNRQTEQFCNDVAGEILLPSAEFHKFHIDNRLGLAAIGEKISVYAGARNLSNTMIAYKLFRTGEIDFHTWDQLRQFYLDMWSNAKIKKRIESHGKQNGPDYYTVHRYRVGAKLISVVKRMVEGGTLTTTKAGKVLGVKAKNVQKLLESNRAN